jgi:hypothetical protein
VWPGVDEAALARAFRGLTAQQIEFTNCDVFGTADKAEAACSGRATFVPKVGGDSISQPRAWHFRLRRDGSVWKIESARVRD